MSISKRRMLPLSYELLDKAIHDDNLEFSDFVLKENFKVIVERKRKEVRTK